MLHSNVTVWQDCNRLIRCWVGAGVFTLDRQRPIVNGKNHYASAGGKHLYYFASTSKWFLANTFDPSKSSAVAWIAAGPDISAEGPVGAMSGRCTLARSGPQSS